MKNQLAVSHLDKKKKTKNEQSKIDDEILPTRFKACLTLAYLDRLKFEKIFV